MRSFACLQLLVIVAIAHGALAQTYPNCALTGLPPAKPTAPHPRCPAANDMSCCTDCMDINTALQLVASNLSTLVTQVAPGFETLVPPEMKVCDVFTGQQQCASYVEEIICAVTCNPETGSFVTTGTNKTLILSVCDAYAKTAYDACTGIELLGFKLTDLLSDPQSFIQGVVVNTVKVLGVPNFNATVAAAGVTDTCFNGASSKPATTACCDPLEVPDTCPAGTVNTTDYASVIGRPINATACPAVPPPAPAGAPTTNSTKGASSFTRSSLVASAFMLVAALVL
eukprot:TRINITY_DN5498_c0_g1_i1.p1 TRINITY_DN5498_c0_g1~~TRINITY_DN5498_c0_g1_i1.p1  ORF type:complete len:284 (+),score=6.46 TRINITY_DN5498_c0_g1_i1:127-978(+)